MAGLTEQQQVFLQGIEMGLTPSKAAARAKYVGNDAVPRLKKNQTVLKAWKAITDKMAEERKISRDDVLDGFKDAIDMAKLQGDPQSMIRGWTEVGKMLGFYAPEVKKLELTHGAKLVRSELEQMSEEELLRLASAEAVDAIEGEFEEVGDED